jgi:hypothetical protein
MDQISINLNLHNPGRSSSNALSARILRNYLYMIFKNDIYTLLNKNLLQNLHVMLGFLQNNAEVLLTYFLNNFLHMNNLIHIILKIRGNMLSNSLN